MSGIEEESSVAVTPRKRLPCTAYFDALMFCYSPVHQMQQYYRAGQLDNCSGKWRIFQKIGPDQESGSKSSGGGIRVTSGFRSLTDSYPTIYFSQLQNCSSRRRLPRLKLRDKIELKIERQNHITEFSILISAENAEYEEHLRSLGDETPSDDTGEQEEISARKRKRDDTIQIPDASSKDKSGQTEVTANPYAKKQRKKKSRSWQYLDEFEVNGEKWVRCKLCQTEIKRDKTCSTTQLNRHVDKCKVTHGLTRQTQLQFQKSGNASEIKRTRKKKLVNQVNCHLLILILLKIQVRLHKV
ncbi:hypothetical protein POM88_008179 [Heracleum sosnowskyi]|uniref:BED-type domain-containing protein n=1 Tax=Heracleum sosnowskyi TaxID=360622 RepID=A0AAD8J6Y1_9APIA|nr:hypothetical protein POM88_008179 [Heracleum sosnowskyi]